MTLTVNTLPAPVPPVICDFGWTYQQSGTYRLPEYTYSIGSSSYPPGKTTLAASVTTGTTPITIPTTLPVSQLSALTSIFPSQGTIVLMAANNTQIAVVTYTGLALDGSNRPSFTGCASPTVIPSLSPAAARRSMIRVTI